MQLHIDPSLAAGYRSQSQIARVLSERWFRENAYCIACTGNHLQQMPANNKSTDFVCPACARTYELKSSAKPHKSLLPDGEYNTMLAAIGRSNPPTLVMMTRTSTWSITSLTALHPVFLTPEMIVKRKPTRPRARNQDWTGCDIRLDFLAPDAKISIIHNNIAVNPSIVRKNFRRFDSLNEIKPSARGWTTLTLRLVRSLQKQTFTSKDIYSLEAEFSAVYPGNHHVRDKIRQQLQRLRDMGFLKFHGDATYSITF